MKSCIRLLLFSILLCSCSRTDRYAFTKRRYYDFGHGDAKVETNKPSAPQSQRVCIDSLNKIAHANLKAEKKSRRDSIYVMSSNSKYELVRSENVSAKQSLVPNRLLPTTNTKPTKSTVEVHDERFNYTVNELQRINKLGKRDDSENEKKAFPFGKLMIALDVLFFILYIGILLSIHTPTSTYSDLAEIIAVACLLIAFALGIIGFISDKKQGKRSKLTHVAFVITILIISLIPLWFILKYGLEMQGN